MGLESSFLKAEVSPKIPTVPVSSTHVMTAVVLGLSVVSPALTPSRAGPSTSVGRLLAIEEVSEGVDARGLERMHIQLS